MRAARLTLLLGALALGGCLRTAFNRCTEEPPHPECAFLDSGVDTGPRADAPADDAAASDAGALLDAPAMPEDAPAAIDAPAASDAPEPADAPDAPATPDAP